MTKADILNTIYQDEEYDKAIMNICREKTHFFEDVKQEIFIMLLEKPEDLIVELYESGKLKFYFVRIVMNQIRSDQSLFYRKYRQTEAKYESSNDFVNDTITSEPFKEDEFEDSFDILAYILDKKILNYGQFEIFNLYFRINPSFLEPDISVTQSYATIAKMLQVSRYTISDDINLIKYKIFRCIQKDGELLPHIDINKVNNFITSFEKTNHNRMKTINKYL